MSLESAAYEFADVVFLGHPGSTCKYDSKNSYFAAGRIGRFCLSSRRFQHGWIHIGTDSRACGEAPQRTRGIEGSDTTPQCSTSISNDMMPISSQHWRYCKELANVREYKFTSTNCKSRGFAIPNARVRQVLRQPILFAPYCILKSGITATVARAIINLRF